MSRLRFFLLTCAVAALALLCSCGGLQPSEPQGRMTLSVTWPEPSRVLPAASKSLLVTVKDGTKTIATKLIPRPASGGTTTVTLDKLPAKKLTDQIVAYPNTDGTGVAQATGTAEVTIEAEDTVELTVTLTSTIQKLELLPANTTQLNVNQSVLVSVSPRDAAQALVLVKPETFQWVSSDPTVASVDATGTVSAKKVGTATVTVTEPESGKKATLTVSVVQNGCGAKPKNVFVAKIQSVGVPDTITFGKTYTIQVTTFAPGDWRLEQSMGTVLTVDGKPFSNIDYPRFEHGPFATSPIPHTITLKAISSRNFGSCYLWFTLVGPETESLWITQ